MADTCWDDLLLMAPNENAVIGKIHRLLSCWCSRSPQSVMYIYKIH